MRNQKIVAMLLVATISFISLIGCRSTTSAVSSSVQNSAVSEASPAVSTQKNLLTVSITLSKEFLDSLKSLSSSTSSGASDSVSSQLADGVVSDTKNSDGSETIVMTREAYDKSMEDMKNNLNDSLDTIKSSCTSIKDISANSDMNDFKVTVDKTKYMGSFDGFALLGIYISSGMYQVFSGVNEPKATFHIFDSDSNQEFSTVTYPDALSSKSSSN